jgi:hypothetical protein
MSPVSTPAASMATIVISSGCSCWGTSIRIQPLSESDISCRKWRRVGCCISTSTIIRRSAHTLAVVPHQPRITVAVSIEQEEAREARNLPPATAASLLLLKLN